MLALIVYKWYSILMVHSEVLGQIIFSEYDREVLGLSSDIIVYPTSQVESVFERVERERHKFAAWLTSPIESDDIQQIDYKKAVEKMDALRAMEETLMPALPSMADEVALYMHGIAHN
jgi:hypothetical protein